MDNRFKCKDFFILMISALIVLLILGCSSEEEGDTSPSTPSSSTKPLPSQPEDSAHLERLTLTAYPIKTKGTSKLKVIKGYEQYFLAVGEYSNGQSKVLTEDLSISDWQISDDTVAKFTQSGVMKGDAPGDIEVYFTKGNLTSNALEVSVVEAKITDIVVTPPAVRVAKGQRQLLTATATYNNGLSMNISDSVTWVPVDPSTVTVTANGVLVGDNVGTTTLTALKDDIASNSVNVNVTDAVLTDISVTPTMLTMAKGQDEPLTAMAMYSDGTSENISDSVAWNLDDTTTVTITPAGLMTGVEMGTTTLNAVKNGVTSNPINVDVTNAVITSINITPSNVTVAKGHRQPLTVTATYSDTSSSDVSDSVTWIPVDTSIATVTAGRLLVGGNVGTTTLTALKDDIASNNVNVNVTDAVLTDISVTPTMLTMAKGQDEPLTAMAMYSDGTSADISDSVTWNPGDTTTVTITPLGKITGSDMGTTTVHAMKNGVTSNPVDVDVTNAVMTGLTLTPPAVGLLTNDTQPMKATVIYSDGTSTDVTDAVIWWTPAGATEMSLTTDGLVTGLNRGSSTIKATHNGFSAEVAVNVCNRDSDGLKGKCIDVYDKGNGYLFTSTPSIAYLDSIGLGGSPHTSSTDGMFYSFKWAKADALCPKYNAINLAGRSNWRLPTLRELRNMYQNMHPMRGWSENTYYWTANVMNGGRGGYWGAYKYYNLSGAFLGHRFSFFVSCFSEP